jgi:hypothetical protein
MTFENIPRGSGAVFKTACDEIPGNTWTVMSIMAYDSKSAIPTATMVMEVPVQPTPDLVANHMMHHINNREVAFGKFLSEMQDKLPPASVNLANQWKSWRQLPEMAISGL